MKASKILNEEIKNLKVASLPSRPTAPSSFGGRGYTATQMKEAFDKLPLYIIERFNALFDDIANTGENSLCGAIPTGIKEEHTLADLITDIYSGGFSDYLKVGDDTLSSYAIGVSQRFLMIDDYISMILSALNSKTVDCGTPKQRNGG